MEQNRETVNKNLGETSLYNKKLSINGSAKKSSRKLLITSELSLTHKNREDRIKAFLKEQEIARINKQAKIEEANKQIELSLKKKAEERMRLLNEKRNVEMKRQFSVKQRREACEKAEMEKMMFVLQKYSNRQVMTPINNKYQSKIDIIGPSVNIDAPEMSTQSSSDVKSKKRAKSGCNMFRVNGIENTLTRSNIAFGSALNTPRNLLDISIHSNHKYNEKENIMTKSLIKNLSSSSNTSSTISTRPSTSFSKQYSSSTSQLTSKEVKEARRPFYNNINHNNNVSIDKLTNQNSPTHNKNNLRPHTLDLVCKNYVLHHNTSNRSIQKKKVQKSVSRGEGTFIIHQNEMIHRSKSHTNNDNKKMKPQVFECNDSSHIKHNSSPLMRSASYTKEHGSQLASGNDNLTIKTIFLELPIPLIYMNDNNEDFEESHIYCDTLTENDKRSNMEASQPSVPSMDGADSLLNLDKIIQPEQADPNNNTNVPVITDNNIESDHSHEIISDNVLNDVYFYENNIPQDMMSENYEFIDSIKPNINFAIDNLNSNNRPILMTEEDAKAEISRKRKLAKELARIKYENEQRKIREERELEEGRIRMEQEEMDRLAKECKEAEEKRLQEAINQHQKKIEDDAKRQAVKEELKRKNEETSRIAAQKLLALEYEKRKKEEERLERKKKLEAIMSRTRNKNEEKKFKENNHFQINATQENMITNSSTEEHSIINSIDMTDITSTCNLQTNIDQNNNCNSYNNANPLSPISFIRSNSGNEFSTYQCIPSLLGSCQKDKQLKNNCNNSITFEEQKNFFSHKNINKKSINNMDLLDHHKFLPNLVNDDTNKCDRVMGLHSHLNTSTSIYKDNIQLYRASKIDQDVDINECNLGNYCDTSSSISLSDVRLLLSKDIQKIITDDDSILDEDFVNDDDDGKAFRKPNIYIQSPFIHKEMCVMTQDQIQNLITEEPFNNNLEKISKYSIINVIDSNKKSKPVIDKQNAPEMEEDISLNSICLKSEETPDKVPDDIFLKQINFMLS